VVVDSGPAIARAPNDVGGLLDTTKGWTLNIPDPRDTATATREISEQQAILTPHATAAAEPSGAAPAIASR
jgi:hypothetical protein